MLLQTYLTPAVGGQGNNVQISMSKKSELESIVTRIEDLTSEIDGDRTDIVDAIFLFEKS